MAIILLGLISTMGIMVFNQLWANNSMLLKKEAFTFARQEIDWCINERIYTDSVYTDSVYTNLEKTLKINRKVESNEKTNKIIVKVASTNKPDKNIIELSVYVKK